MQIITAAKERYSITVNGWIIGHKKDSANEYADPNYVRSTLFVIGTLASTARAFVSEHLRSQWEIPNIVCLGVDHVPDQDLAHVKGMVILTPELGFANDRTRRNVIETLNTLANASKHEHDLTVLLPATVGYYELMEDMIAYMGRNNGEFFVQVPGAESHEKASDDDRSVFTFDDYVKLRAANVAVEQFICADGPVGSGCRVHMHESLSVLDGRILFKLATGLRNTGLRVLLHFDVWRNIYNYLDGDARRIAYFDSKPCEQKAVEIRQ